MRPTTEPNGTDLYDPDWYATGDVHGTFAELRAWGPVHWQDMEGEPGFWAVLTHAGVTEVAKHPERFSASVGTRHRRRLPAPGPSPTPPASNKGTSFPYAALQEC